MLSHDVARVADGRPFLGRLAWPREVECDAALIGPQIEITSMLPTTSEGSCGFSMLMRERCPRNACRTASAVG